MKKIFLLIMVAIVMIGAGISLLRHQRTSEVVSEVETSEEQMQDQQVSDQAQISKPANASSGLPNRLQVPSVGIDITVAKGYYNQRTQKWTLSRDKAHFAIMTSRPNSQGGNTYIYGHNRKEVFTRLTKVKPGAEATVFTETGQKFTYRMTKSITTKPEDSSMLFYEGAPILTLQTCTGALYQNRTLYVFELVGVTDA